METQQKNKNDKKVEKKKYEKPQIIHTSKIETLAGSCASLGGCIPAAT